MDSRSDTEKNQKTGLPPIKLYLMDMDEATKHKSSWNIGHLAISWPLAMLVTERSGTGKTNLLVNLVLRDKSEYIYKRQKGDSDILGAIIW